MRLIVVWLLAGCSLEHGVPAGATGGDGGPDDAPVAIDAPRATTDAPPTDAMCPDDDSDGVCNAVDYWPCGAKPAALPTMLSWMRNGTATSIRVSNISLDNAGQLVVAAPNKNLAFKLDFMITDTACPVACVDQLEIGWVPAGNRWGCIFDQTVSKQNGASGTAIATLKSGVTPQVYDLRIELGQNTGCTDDGHTNWWDGQTPAANRTIAKLCVH